MIKFFFVVYWSVYLEYAFGKGKSGTGVWIQRPTREPGNCKFKETIDIGYCTKPSLEILQIIDKMKVEYQATSYSLITRNCNNFADDLCKRLCGVVCFLLLNVYLYIL